MTNSLGPFKSLSVHLSVECTPKSILRSSLHKECTICFIYIDRIYRIVNAAWALNERYMLDFCSSTMVGHLHISLTYIPFISQLNLTGRYDYLCCTDKETGQQRNSTISHKHWELTFNSCSTLQMLWKMEDRDSFYERGHWKHGWIKCKSVE